MKVNIETMINSEPITNLVNLIIYEGISGKAAEIHIEPGEEAMWVRYFDNEGSKIPGHAGNEKLGAMYIYPVLVARLKTMAGLDYRNTTDPSQGKFELKRADKAVNLELSTTPGESGELVVLKIIRQEK